MTITRNFKLCLNAGTQNAPYINVNQYDEGEQWIFDLYTEGGQKFTPSTGAIIGIKSDGNAILNSGTVNSDGQVVITETQQMTAASGLAVFELLIEGETHGTANFIVNVERRPSDDAEFSDSDLSMLQEAIDAAEVINEILDEGGDPSEIITENVNAWLDNHPEATTTVLDGAITAPKINNSLWDKLLVSEEASGAVASFDDGADDVPVSSLKVALEPIQLGSGDPSPTNIRPIIAANGKNLYPIKIGRDVWGNNASGTHSTDNDVLTVTVTTASSSGVYSTGTSQFASLTQTLTGTYSYSLSAKASANGSYILGFYGAGRETKAVTTQWQRFTFTGTFDGTGKTFNICGTGTAGTIEIKDFMLETGSTASAYQPYQGIMVERCGKNLLNPNILIAFNSGNYLATSNYTATGTIQCKPNTTYTLSLPISKDEDGRVYGFDANGTRTTLSGTFGSNVTFTTGADTVSLSMYCKVQQITDISTVQIMLEEGSTASDYEAYVGTSYPYSLGQTVYGGTVDLATGVLTVTKKFVTSSNFVKETSYDVGNSSLFSATGINDANSNPTLNRGSISDKLKYDTAILNVERAGFYVGYGHIYARIAGISTLSDFNTAIGGSLSVAYTLATPQTIQLTPQEVKTLLGYNNISSTGTVDVIYHADTKLYIDKRIAELG